MRKYDNWVRIIARVKRLHKQRMEELREEVDVKENLRRNLARSRLKWAGHVERMEGERLTKRVDALRVEGRRRLRWEDCVKGHLVGLAGEWRTRAKGNGDRWWRQQ